MMRTLLKILGGGILVLLFCVIAGAFWLFSSSGNAFLKDKITQIINEKAPIDLEFTHFSLKAGSYAFVITDKEESQIAFSGDYSLLHTNAKMKAIIKDLAAYESLLGLSLKGSVSVHADVVANLKAFDGSFSVQSAQITLPKAQLNALSGLQFKQDLVFALEGNGAFYQRSGSANLYLKGKEFQAEVQNAKFDLSDNVYSADFSFNTDEVAKINPLKMHLKGALHLKGSVSYANNLPSLVLQNHDFGDLNLVLKDERLLLSGTNLELKKIARFVDDKFVKSGIANVNADVTLKIGDALIKHLNGVVELQAKHLEIYSLDIDALTKSYENTNSINLLDVGAFVFAGPLGVAATKGGNIGKLGFHTMVDGKSLIKHLEAKFTLNDGVANASDVAFATGKTRIAAKGAINLNHNTFEDFSIAILEANNCPKFSQTIKGTLSNPSIEATTLAKNLATSLFKSLKKGAQTLTGKGDACATPFYNGVVQHPSKEQ